MPTAPRRRESSTRRPLPPRPSFATPVIEVASPGDDARQRREAERAATAAVRESRYLIAELKRVVGVTATCVGMLVVLAILQRMAQ